MVPLCIKNSIVWSAKLIWCCFYYNKKQIELKQGEKTMANYAFVDEARTQKIYANDDNIMQYKSVRCYCKNPNCDAKMFIYRPEHKNSAFFKASGKPGHQGACGLSPHRFSKINYIEEDFVFPQGLFSLLTDKRDGENKGRKNGNHNGGQEKFESRPLRGLKEVYSMLTNTDIDDTYNDYLIKDMIADERTYQYYKNGISGYKIVECNFYKYSDAGFTITMNYPTFPNHKGHLELWFDDKELYEKMKPRIKGKNHDGIVVVFGEWKINTKDGINYVNLSSENQIAVIKKES